MTNPNIHGVKKHAPLMEMRRESENMLMNNLIHHTKNEANIMYYLKLKLCLLLKDRSSSKEDWKLSQK